MKTAQNTFDYGQVYDAAPAVPVAASLIGACVNPFSHKWGRTFKQESPQSSGDNAGRLGRRFWRTDSKGGPHTHIEGITLLTNPTADPNDPASQPTAQPPNVNNTPNAPQLADPAQPASNPAIGAPAQTSQPIQDGQPSQPSQPSQNGNQTGTVANVPAPVHPSVQRAGVIRQIATALAGGPRYSETIDPQTGATTRTQLPMSKSDIGMAIALEAISGSLAGAGARGPNHMGEAAQAGFAQVSAQQRQAQQEQDQAAQQQYENQSKALVQKGAIAYQNQQSLLTAQQAERLGMENMQTYVDSQVPILSEYQDLGAIGDQHVTSEDIQAGLASGKYNSTQVTSIPDGITELNGRPELTYSIVTKPQEKLTLTQDQVDELAAGHVKGYPSGLKIPPGGFPVSGYMLTSAYTQLAANRMTVQEAGDVVNTLANSSVPAYRELAKTAPDFDKLLGDKDQGPVLQDALAKLPKYMHHDGSGDNFYEALVAMSQPTRPNPANPKQSIPNTRDASAANTIFGAFGDGDPAKGRQVLQAFHDESTPEPIKSESEAESILSDDASTPREKAHAQAFLNTSAQQKATEAGATARAKKPVLGASSGTTASGPSDVRTISDAIANGRTTFEQATQGMGREAAAFRRQVEADILTRYPNLNLQALKSYSHDADNVGVQSQVQMARSLFGSYGQPGSFDDVENAIRAVPKSSVPILSGLKQRTAYELGSPEMARLKTIQTDLATDLAKFNTGAGSRGSDHQLDLYREQLQSAQTPEQIEAAVKEIRSVSQKRLNGIVGTNPYLKYMVRDVNDPVSRMPMGAPSGAKGTVKGADGKLHWSSNGRDDLGVVQ